MGDIRFYETLKMMQSQKKSGAACGIRDCREKENSRW